MIGRPLQHELLGLARQLVAQKLVEVSKVKVHPAFWRDEADHNTVYAGKTCWEHLACSMSADCIACWGCC